MYTKFYGFNEKPFNVTPDARFFYPSKVHSTALDAMYYVITERRGFAVLTGNIGAGKTTLWRALMKRLDIQTTKTAIITNSHITQIELVEALLEEVGLEPTGLTKNRMISQLNEYLIKEFAQRNTVVLIVDEAQNLSPDVLEEIRMLSNLETEQEKLLQIIMIGQPEFRDKLKLPSLAQLRQRITVAVHLEPLSREETENYIKFRISKVSTNNNIDIFTSGAYDKIYELSGGIPRLINSICDGTLLVGYASGSHVIEARLIEETIDDLLSFTCPAFGEKLVSLGDEQEEE